MKKLFYIAVMATMTLLVSSCSNDIPEGFIQGANGELLEVNTNFQMAEFLNDVYGTEWATVSVYERDGNETGDNIYEGMYGYYGTLYKFADDEIIGFINMMPLVTSGIPKNGEQFLSSADAYSQIDGEVALYYYPDPYIVDENNNMLSFAADDTWTIAGYSSEYIIIDYEDDGRPLRLILESCTFNDCLKDARNYYDYYYTDWIEYFEKYDADFVEDAIIAAETESISTLFQIKITYDKKWGTNFSAGNNENFYR